MPNSFCETPDGTLLIADGFGPVLAWDGFTGSAREAGVPAPTAKPALAFNDLGLILGTYRIYTRWVDDKGNPSNLSPASDEVEVLVSTGGITNASNTTPILLTMTSHGLVGSPRLRVQGVLGNTGANGTWDTEVVDANTVRLIGSFTGGPYTGGGTWSAGAGRVTYSNVELPTDPRVTRRQVLRNTDGQQTVFYVDVDTADLSSTTFTSTSTDAELRAKTAVTLVDDQGGDIANTHGIPPSFKAFLCNHKSLIFMAGSVEYTEGAVKMTTGSPTVTGIGTEWKKEAAGRFLFVVDGDKRYEIQACNPVAQTLTLTQNYTGPSNPYALYAIRVSLAEDRIVWFSNAEHAEGFSPFRSFAVPDVGDEITGIMSFDSFVYLVERRHTWRYSYQENPLLDGGIYPNLARGCVNHRCFAETTAGMHMLDEYGVHMFSGAEQRDVSEPIQTLFRADGPGPKINWSASRWFHAVVDSGQETIKWFVALAGDYLPRHCLTYQYNLGRWGVDDLAVPVGSSVVGRLYRTAPLLTWGDGRPQVYLGGPARRVLATGLSPLDGVHPALSPHAGVVALAGTSSLTADPLVEFHAECVGAPVAITAGRGKGQLRIIAEVSGNVLTLTQPWAVRPDATSSYQVGGILWHWESGWFRWAEEEEANPRSCEIIFDPPAAPLVVDFHQYNDRIVRPVAPSTSRTQDGVASRNGDPDVRVDVAATPGGVAQLRMDSGRLPYARGNRYVSVGLAGFGGEGVARLLQVTIDGAVTPSSREG